MGRRAKKVIRTRDADASQRALLEAGAKLFAEKGYEAATLEDLAAAAGLTKAMVRYHFEDKANFYRAVVWESIDHIAEALEAVRDANLEPELKLTRYVGVLAEALRERPHLGGMLSNGAAPATLAKDEALVENLLRLFLATKAVLAEGQRKGAFRKVDPHLFHLSLIGAIIYFVTTQRFRDEMTFKPGYRGPEPRFDAFVRMLQQNALRSLAPVFAILALVFTSFASMQGVACAQPRAETAEAAPSAPCAYRPSLVDRLLSGATLRPA